MKIAEYEGALLNHVETLYRPGERALAVALAEALGCAVTDTGFKGDCSETFLAAHPNPQDQDVQNNAFYMSPQRPEQQALEERLGQLIDAAPDLQARLQAYRETARTKPFGVPHFAIRYRSNAEVEAVAERLSAGIGRRLSERLHLRVFRPGAPDGAAGLAVQAFVHQDVIVSGSFLYGQLIELQGRAPAP